MQITIEDLKQYQELKREIRAIQYRIEQIRYSSPSPKEVIGGRSSASVPSNPTEQKALDLAEKEELLEDRLRALMIYQARIERFVYFDCERSDVRDIIDVHYLQGKTWATTSWVCCNMSPNASTAQMIIKRYFEGEDNEQMERD